MINNIEEKLKESEAQLQAIVSSSQDAIVMMDDKGKIVFWNGAAEKIFGYTQNDVLGKDLHQLITVKEEHHTKKESLNTFFATGMSPVLGKIIELPVKNKNGNELTIELTVSGAMVGGKHFGVGIMRNITDRKISEKVLRESEEKYRLIAENATDGIITFDANNKVLYVSPGYTKQFGYSEKEELERGTDEIASIIHPEDQKKVFDDIFEAIKNKKTTLLYSYRMKKKDGDYLWREDNAKFNYDSDGKYLGSYVVSRDITERKKIEGELRDKMEQLEKTNQYMIDRELRMVELKEEIKKIKK